ncbi:MAG: hypothetical protein UFG06_03545 [Lachnospiraceae bacterium]|nr:hypothetical protein [Lachnospiraceae bacterium]
MSRDEQKKPDKIQAFDTLFTTNHIQMYKILLPYFEPAMQKQMAVYIKFMEFEYTLSYFKLHPFAGMPTEKPNDTSQICREISPYCSASEKASIEKIMEMFSSMQNAREMMDTFNMMKDMFPDGFSFGDGAESADAMQMFQMFNNFK